ncbi:fumarylacetoacetate hydrolase family protein [Nocardia fluminea]
MTTHTAVTEAAQRLASAAAQRLPCAPVRDLIGSTDIDAAYRVQSRNITAALTGGRHRVGRKIGLTSPAVQQQLGVDQPDFGVLLDDMDCTGQDRIGIDRLLQPRIEAEIAFVLRSDIPGRITADQARGAVERVHAAFEIVDSRVADWNISLADTVADNASSGLFVLGDAVPVGEVPDLAAVTMTMSADGEHVSSGRGADCLGSPWEALAWLANTSLSYGSPLRAGEVILSGALGPMVAVEAGFTYSAAITGVGTVLVSFSGRSA